MQRVILFVIIFTVVLSGGLAPPVGTVKAEESSTTDTPTALVSGGVTKYTLAAPKVFWYTGVPPCPPALASDQIDSAAQFTETIKRIATYGSPVRTLYSELRDCGQGQVLSNMVADDDYIYWLGPDGLMRLSTDANPGDAPELVNALVNSPGELAMASDRVYAIFNNTGGSNTKIGYVLKSNNQRVVLTSPGNTAGNLQTDGTYIYYLVSGSLIRLEPGVDNGVSLTSGVSGYYAEGSRLTFCTINPFKCYFSNNVYVGKGRYIYIYNNDTNSLGSTPIYTSPDATASVYELVTDLSRLFFFERRTIPCSPDPCLNSYSYVVNRTSRAGGSADALYTYGPTLLSGLQNLNTYDSYLFWHEDAMVQRLPNDASALPQVNMYITGIEVTQGIQNLNNSVKLIKNRRTFVRVFVKAEGTSVSGVTAQLSAPSIGAGPLQPVNPVGTKITVRTNPDRNDLDQSFLFELPWNWTKENSLNLQANLNPYKVPLEPNYGDNVSNIAVSLDNSPALSVEFFRLNYNLNNTTYSPRISEDVLKTYSWIMRAYPIGGAVGEYFKPRLWDVDGGTGLGSLVNRSNFLCTLVYPDPDDRNLCASYFTNGWLFYYRIATMFGVLNVGLKADAFYYGMISDASNNFPRGQAVYDRTSVGPAGTPGQFFGLGSGWDTDGSYADWYAAHEIGHSLGRAHPNAGSDDPATKDVFENCRHSRSDPNFPYGNTSSASAPIGPGDGSMEGFDFGDPTFGIGRAVLPSATWNDVMSYCASQWISDYTYQGMYNYMSSHPSLAAEVVDSAVLAIEGDFLAVSGVINPEEETAGFSLIRRLDNVVDVPPLVSGDYSLRLLDSGDNPLATYAFTPATNDDLGVLTFGQVVDFVAGTRKVQILKTDGNQVLTSVPVSANKPQVTEVTLVGASSPVSGEVTLNWNASDADGDVLSYDIAYSRDNGGSFQPIAVNVNETTAQIDTSNLGGSGTAILRVTTSDGINTGFADSAPFVMADKPPQVFILDPGDNTHIHYGQLVNFNGLAMDAQDSIVPASGLVWKNSQASTLGTGPQLSLENLPVGTNVITLQATNSVGESASASVTVIVDDDLTLPGPTLTAGPLQVSWQVPAGSTQVQSAQLSINNAGSGALDWTASEDADWLSLSAANGSVSAEGAPSALTLSADPSGLASGTTSTATLTITKPASGEDPAQSIEIPVTLSVGDVWTVSPQEPYSGQMIFVPLVSR